MTISLCLIMRDEQQNLRRCLNSAASYVDELIAVDTGSTDESVNIAREFGAKVVELPWTDDFALARNAGLKLASGEWILVLDADEELPACTAEKLPGLTRESGVEAWTFVIISPTHNGLKTRHLNLRMFRNREEYRFVGRIHEQIKPGIEKHGGRIEHSGLAILHYGYLPSQRHKKALRNIKILHDILRGSPDDPFHNYNIGTSYYSLGEFTKACRHFARALKNTNRDSGLAPMLYRNYCLSLYELGMYRDVLTKADEALACFPDYPDLLFIKGQVFWDLGMLKEAEASFIHCTHFRKVPAYYTTTEGVTTFLAYENLAEGYTLTGELDKAAHYLEQAYRSNPSYRLVVSLGWVLKMSGLAGKEIVSRVKESLNIQPETLGRLCFDLGEFKRGAEILQECKPTTEISLQRAMCLLKLGRFSEARALLTELDHDHSDEALELTCLSYWLARESAASGINRLDEHAGYLAAIDSLIFDTASPGLEPEKALGMAGRAVLFDDIDLALAITRRVADNPGEVFCLLGEQALQHGRFREAEKLLAFAQSSPSLAKSRFLLGEVLRNLGKHEAAFVYYLKAFQEDADYELSAACALSELAASCLSSVSAALNRKPDNLSLAQVLLKLASLRKQLEGVKVVTDSA